MRPDTELFRQWRADPLLFVAQAFEGFAPEPWQAQAWRLVAEHDRIAIRSGHGVGKEQSIDELVLTPGGWVRIGDIAVGDRVISIDGRATSVVGVYPQGVRELFRVTLDDGCSAVAGGEHLWFTTTRSERKHGRPGGLRTTREIASSLTFPNGRARGLNHRLPNIEAVEGMAAILPVEPYLLGVWLGDGQRGTGSYTKPDEGVATELRAVGQSWGRVGGTGRRTVRGLRGGLRLLGLLDMGSHDRFVPEVYRRAPPKERHAVLQGILDTDGTVGANMGVVLDTTAPRLADDVAELVRSLGGVVRRSGKRGMLNGVAKRWVYRLFIALPETWPPFRSATKANRYRPSHDHKNRERTLGRFVRRVEPCGRGETVCIEAAHSSGMYLTRDHIPTHNSAWLALLIIWWLVTHFPAKVVCTASKAHQLEDVLWAEVAKWLRRMKPEFAGLFEVKSDKIELRGAGRESFAVARTARPENPEAFQGFHSENLLFIADEASGVPDAIFEVGEGSMSTPGAKTVLAGNPTRVQGYFHDAFHKMRRFWKVLHVPCSVSSQVDPGYIEKMAARYGVNSNTYRVRVLGDFPTGEDDQVIPLYLVEAAVSRDVEPIPGRAEIWGLDVARFGDDRSALAKRRGNVLNEPVKFWQGKDTMQTVNLVHAEYNAAKVKPAFIMVDSIGLGAGVQDRLRELGLPSRGIAVSERPSVKGKHMRLRDELWFTAREFFEKRDSRIPDQEDLIGELAGPSFTFTSGGLIKVESKEDMKKRGVFSPDLADAFCLTFAMGDVSQGAHKKKLEYDHKWVV